MYEKYHFIVETTGDYMESFLRYSCIKAKWKVTKNFSNCNQ